MKVFRIGTSEVSLIEEGLQLLEERKHGSYAVLKCMGFPQEEIDRGEYEVAHVRTTRKLLEDMRLQELCERCLSYFWDRFEDMGCSSEEIEWLMEDMGIGEEEMRGLFREAGFEE